MKKLLVVAGLVLSSASGLSAQTRWDSPFLTPPRPTAGYGLFLWDVYRGGLGALFTWIPTQTSWGLRVGIADAPGDQVAFFGGGDVSGGITRSSSDFPFDMDWVFGIGISASDFVVLSVPVGLTLGHTFTGQGVTFTPYITPRLVFDALFDSPGDDTDLDFTADIGFDLRFRSNVTVRFGATLSDREALAIGVVFR
jgi:hypothetical protein